VSVLSLNVIRFGSWLVFLAAWLILLFQMITKWGVMSVDHHYDGKRLAFLSITHKSGTKDEAELDIGEPGDTSP
jgi:hypothetical protein